MDVLFVGTFAEAVLRCISRKDKEAARAFLSGLVALLKPRYKDAIPIWSEMQDFA